MFYNADSGLYLTQYRTYDPVVERWLSRDPLGEGSDSAANLYRYADDNPLSNVDPNGLWQLTIAAGTGYGGAVTFGYNSGQFNFGPYAGVGTGATLTINPCNGPPPSLGVATSVMASAGGGLVLARLARKLAP